MIRMVKQKIPTKIPGFHTNPYNDHEAKSDGAGTKLLAGAGV